MIVNGCKGDVQFFIIQFFFEMPLSIIIIQPYTLVKISGFKITIKKIPCNKIQKILLKQKYAYELIRWLIEPGGLKPHSQVLSNNSYSEPNKSNYRTEVYFLPF